MYIITWSTGTTKENKEYIADKKTGNILVHRRKSLFNELAFHHDYHWSNLKQLMK